ncbi:MAG: hypothetical protein K1X67_08095 [Fimbriimonadaceae bacterium]|nr:hypothetical protein [Fimbriimonadaceae bacterium]
MARADTALWSINERLGSLCGFLGAPAAGCAMPEPSIDWVGELLETFRSDEDEGADPNKDPLANIPGTITD